jgi:hypothetical protein
MDAGKVLQKVTGVKVPQGLELAEEQAAKVAKLHRDAAKKREEGDHEGADLLEEAAGMMRGHYKFVQAAAERGDVAAGAPNVGAIGIEGIPREHITPAMTRREAVEGNPDIHIQSSYPLRGGVKWGMVQVSTRYGDRWRIVEMNPNGSWRGTHGPPLTKNATHNLLTDTIVQHQADEGIPVTDMRNAKDIFMKYEKATDAEGRPLASNPDRMPSPLDTPEEIARRQAGTRRAFVPASTQEAAIPDEFVKGQHDVIVNPKELEHFAKGEHTVSGPSLEHWASTEGVKPGEIVFDVYGKKSGDMHIVTGKNVLAHAIAADIKEIPITVRHYPEAKAPKGGGGKRLSPKVRARMMTGHHTGKLFGKAAEGPVVSERDLPIEYRSFEDLQRDHARLAGELEEAKDSGDEAHIASVQAHMDDIKVEFERHMRQQALLSEAQKALKGTSDVRATSKAGLRRMHKDLVAERDDLIKQEFATDNPNEQARLKIELDRVAQEIKLLDAHLKIVNKPRSLMNITEEAKFLSAEREVKQAQLKQSERDPVTFGPKRVADIKARIEQIGSLIADLAKEKSKMLQETALLTKSELQDLKLATPPKEGQTTYVVVEEGKDPIVINASTPEVALRYTKKHNDSGIKARVQERATGKEATPEAQLKAAQAAKLKADKEPKVEPTPEAAPAAAAETPAAPVEKTATPSEADIPESALEPTPGKTPAETPTPEQPKTRRTPEKAQPKSGKKTTTKKKTTEEAAPQAAPTETTSPTSPAEPPPELVGRTESYSGRDLHSEQPEFVLLASPLACGRRWKLSAAGTKNRWMSTGLLLMPVTRRISGPTLLLMPRTKSSTASRLCLPRQRVFQPPLTSIGCSVSRRRRTKLPLRSRTSA